MPSWALDSEDSGLCPIALQRTGGCEPKRIVPRYTAILDRGKYMLNGVLEEVWGGTL